MAQLKNEFRRINEDAIKQQEALDQKNKQQLEQLKRQIEQATKTK
jgi:hypothetical protein